MCTLDCSTSPSLRYRHTVSSLDIARGLQLEMTLDSLLACLSEPVTRQKFNFVTAYYLDGNQSPNVVTTLTLGMWGELILLAGEVNADACEQATVLRLRMASLSVPSRLWATASVRSPLITARDCRLPSSRQGLPSARRGRRATARVPRAAYELQARWYYAPLPSVCVRWP